MIIIDCQSHVYPKHFFDLLACNPGFPRARKDGSKTIIDYTGISPISLFEERFDPLRKLQDMDRGKIDIAVISHVIPGPCMLPLEIAIEGAQVINEYIAELVQKYPNRFAGLACLPWQDPLAAIREMDRAQTELGLCGAMLYSNIGGKPIDDPVFEPIYAHAEEKGVPLVLHPTVPGWAEVINDYWMVQLLGFPVDTSIALLRLILSGMLDRHPNLNIVMPHVGGILPYMIGRVDQHQEAMKAARERISHAPSAYLRRIHLDTASSTAETVHYAYNLSGGEHLLFATDHPWGDPQQSVDLIKNLDISVETKEMILGGNAAVLFGLK